MAKNLAVLLSKAFIACPYEESKNIESPLFRMISLS
jgi:hypothetical protein